MTTIQGKKRLVFFSSQLCTLKSDDVCFLVTASRWLRWSCFWLQECGLVIQMTLDVKSEPVGNTVMTEWLVFVVWSEEGAPTATSCLSVVRLQTTVRRSHCLPRRKRVEARCRDLHHYRLTTTGFPNIRPSTRHYCLLQWRPWLSKEKKCLSTELCPNGRNWKGDGYNSFQMAGRPNWWRIEK